MIYVVVRENHTSDSLFICSIPTCIYYMFIFVLTIKKIILIFSLRKFKILKNNLRALVTDGGLQFQVVTVAVD